MCAETVAANKAQITNAFFIMKDKDKVYPD